MHNQKLKKIIKSRDAEIVDLKKAVAHARSIRGLYTDQLIKLGMSHKDIKAIRREAKVQVE